MKKATKRAGPTFVFSGTIAPVTGDWHAVYFETDPEVADRDSVTTLRVACWAACARGKDHIVGGMVAGVSGLELAELDRDFRGYVPEDTAKERAEFVALWEGENGYGEDDEDDEESDDEDE